VCGCSTERRSRLTQCFPSGQNRGVRPLISKRTPETRENLPMDYIDRLKRTAIRLGTIMVLSSGAALAQDQLTKGDLVQLVVTLGVYDNRCEKLAPRLLADLQRMAKMLDKGDVMSGVLNEHEKVDRAGEAKPIYAASCTGPNRSRGASGDRRCRIARAAASGASQLLDLGPVTAAVREHPCCADAPIVISGAHQDDAAVSGQRDRRRGISRQDSPADPFDERYERW
jgi:hypothetical protein